jgi:hypothetical protein
MRVYVIYDSEGRVVGTQTSEIQRVTTDRGEAEVQMTPVPQEGQTIHEVELPSELDGLEAAELHNALAGYDVRAGEARLVKRG